MEQTQSQIVTPICWLGLFQIMYTAHIQYLTSIQSNLKQSKRIYSMDLAATIRAHSHIIHITSGYRCIMLMTSCLLMFFVSAFCNKIGKYTVHGLRAYCNRWTVIVRKTNNNLVSPSNAYALTIVSRYEINCGLNMWMRVPAEKNLQSMRVLEYCNNAGLYGVCVHKICSAVVVNLSISFTSSFSHQCINLSFTHRFHSGLSECVRQQQQGKSRTHSSLIYWFTVHFTRPYTGNNRTVLERPSWIIIIEANNKRLLYESWWAQLARNVELF